VYSGGSQPALGRNTPPPSSLSKSEPSRKPAVLAAYFVLDSRSSYFPTLKEERHISPERLGMFTGVHGNISQKEEVFILTSARTSSQEVNIKDTNN
jgi:hypothetical protein